MGGNGGGDNKPAVSSYSGVEETHFIAPKFCCSCGSDGGDSFVFLLGNSLLSRSWWPKLLESDSSRNFPIILCHEVQSYAFN